MLKTGIFKDPERLTFLLKSLDFRLRNMRFYSSSLIPIKMSFASYENTEVNHGKSPLLIMHGLFGSKSNWNSLSKAIHLKSQRKVIALDARNHGDSPHTEEFSYELLSADIDHFIKSNSLEPVNILGHSMGGRAMMYYALEHPENIEKLIVLDISPLHTSSDIHNLYSYFSIMEKIKLDINIPMSEGRRKADEQLKAHILSEDIRNFLLTNLVKTPQGFKWRVNLKSLSNAFTKEIANFSPPRNPFTKPALFIGGTKSDYLLPKDENKIREMFPLATFKYINAGHWVHAEKPAEFLSIVTDYLDDV